MKPGYQTFNKKNNDAHKVQYSGHIFGVLCPINSVGTGNSNIIYTEIHSMYRTLYTKAMLPGV